MRHGIGRALVVAGLVVAIGVLSACGSANADGGVATAGGARPNPSGSDAAQGGDRTEQLRQFAQCMRDNGVDVADPDAGGGFQPGAGATRGPGGFDRNNPNFQKAIEACRDKLPNGGQPPKLSAEQLEQYRQFAQCMRDHGADVPDPNPDGTLQFGRGRATGQFDPNDPTFSAALNACRDKIAGVFPGRPGGGA